MKMVLDASAALRAVIAGPTQPSVVATMRRATTVLAPHLFFPEVANGLLKYVVAGQVSVDDAIHFAEDAYGFVREWRGLQELSEEALRVAAKFRHPVYDCYYAVLARRERATVFTFDQRLKRLLAAMDVASI